jgi:hypothetical protein
MQYPARDGYGNLFGLYCTRSKAVHAAQMTGTEHFAMASLSPLAS